MWVPHVILIHMNPLTTLVRPGYCVHMCQSNPGSTRVNNPSSTLLRSRFEPFYGVQKRVKNGRMRTDLERPRDYSFNGEVAIQNYPGAVARTERNVRRFLPVNCRRASQAGSSTNTEILFLFLSLQLVTARGKYDRYLCLTQTVLHCRPAVDMRGNRNE